MSDWQERFHELVERTKEYFGQLNEYERYCWGAQALGLILIIVGIILW